LDPELLDMIRIGLAGYFSDDSSSLLQRFPNPIFPPPEPTPDDSDTASTSEASSVSSSSSLHDQHAADSTQPHPLFSEDPYIQLRQTQDAIGWDHFFRGKLSDDWNRLQYKYACRYSKLEQSKNWIPWLIKYMATQAHNLWLSRNRDRHGHDSASQYHSKMAQARRDVTALYSHIDTVLPQDRDLFCASLELHLLQPLSQLQSWLSLNQPMILSSVRQAKDRSIAKTPRLSRFFTVLQKKKSSIKKPPDPPPARPRVFHPSRMTRFATSVTKRRSSLPAPVPSSQPLSQISPPHPRIRQRYLFQFFPNHPG
jgi:hypothetical protein